MGSSSKNKKSSSAAANTTDTDDWKKQIVSLLKGAKKEDDDNESSKGSLPVKKLRRLVFLSILKQDEDDDDDDEGDQRKAAKKTFKKTVQMLETQGIVSLNADGVITLLTHDAGDDDKKKKKKRKEEKEDQKKKKRQRTNSQDEKEDAKDTKNDKQSKHNEHDDDDDDDDDDNKDHHQDNQHKNKPCPGNPQGITRLFLGNLPFAIDEQGLGDFFGRTTKVTHIQWITDKATGKFYGSAFVEMDTSVSAAHAVSLAGSSLSGRPIKINFAPARPGDVWPPPTKIVTGGSSSGGVDNNKAKSSHNEEGGVLKPMSEKPEGCHKLFIGNLSYEIDDDKLKAFFASVDAEVKAVRWLHHKENGDFKGCGFVEFWNTEACDKAATLNGKNLLGRKIRIDWSD